MSIKEKPLKRDKSKMRCAECGGAVKSPTLGQTVSWMFNGVFGKSARINDVKVGNYNSADYEESLFPTKAALTDASYESDWRDELKEVHNSEWLYSQHIDEMRKRVVYFASKISLNSVAFASPYDVEGGSFLSIELRQASDRPSAIALTITKGQITSNRQHQHIINVKFDDGDIESYSWHKSNADRKTIVIYEGAGKFIDKLKNSKHIMIEMTFYSDSSYEDAVFKFDVSGLVWDYKPMIDNGLAGDTETGGVDSNASLVSADHSSNDQSINGNNAYPVGMKRFIDIKHLDYSDNKDSLSLALGELPHEPTYFEEELTTPADKASITDSEVSDNASEFHYKNISREDGLAGADDPVRAIIEDFDENARKIGLTVEDINKRGLSEDIPIDLFDDFEVRNFDK